MASIQNSLLTLEESGNGWVKVIVRYTVFQHPLEYWSNTIYNEDIRLIGDDPPFNPAAPSGTDITVAIFPSYSIRNPHAPSVVPPIFTFERHRVLHVRSESLNEDPGFTASGLPLRDEIFALITLSPVANIPWFPGPFGPFPPGPFPGPGPFPLPTMPVATAQTNTVTGHW